VTTYDSYLGRSHWEPSEPLHRWVARRALVSLGVVAGRPAHECDLLEIGTGTGRVAVAAKALGYRSYVGVEPTPALAQYARDLTGATILDDRLPDLKSIPDESFDQVFSMHVLEHSSGFVEAREWCEEMLRVTRPGGHVCVVAPDIRDYRTYFWDGDWTHGYPTTPQRVSQIFTDLSYPPIHSGSMHLGGTGGVAAFLAHVGSALVPTRLGDVVSNRIFGRPLASGLKIACLWGLTFVVAQKANTG